MHDTHRVMRKNERKARVLRAIAREQRKTVHIAVLIILLCGLVMVAMRSVKGE